jgi:hypothetical protein
VLSAGFYVVVPFGLILHLYYYAPFPLFSFRLILRGMVFMLDISLLVFSASAELLRTSTAKQYPWDTGQSLVSSQVGAYEAITNTWTIHLDEPHNIRETLIHAYGLLHV